MEFGYIKKRRANEKRPKITSRPFHYISSDGYDIFVGKNNYQNEELTFKVASGNDWWFHAKGIPGSHVIVKSNGQSDLPDRDFEEAGALAAYYSKGRENDKVEIDYIQKKNNQESGWSCTRLCDLSYKLLPGSFSKMRLAGSKIVNYIGNLITEHLITKHSSVVSGVRP